MSEMSVFIASPADGKAQVLFGVSEKHLDPKDKNLLFCWDYHATLF